MRISRNMSEINEKIKTKAIQLIDGSSEERNGEQAGAELINFLEENLTQIDSPILFIGYIHLVEAIEKLRSPHYCYAPPFRTKDYRLERPWHTSNAICKLISNFSKTFLLQNYFKDEEENNHFLSEIESILNRRKIILLAGENISEYEKTVQILKELKIKIS